MMVHRLGRVHHFDGFMNSRIERLSDRLNHLDAHFLEHILELTIDEFEPAPEIVGISGRSLERAFKAVQNRQNVPDDLGSSKFAELLLFSCRTFAGIIEFGLQRSASRSALSFSVSDIGPSSSTAVGSDGRADSSAPSAGGNSCSTSRLLVSVFPFPLPILLNYSDSFKSLSNRRAMYDTADMVC